MTKSEEAQATCSFCGKTNLEVDQIIAGGNACICDQCIMGCLKVLVYGEPEPQVIDLGDEDVQSSEGC